MQCTEVLFAGREDLIVCSLEEIPGHVIDSADMLFLPAFHELSKVSLASTLHVHSRICKHQQAYQYSLMHANK